MSMLAGPRRKQKFTLNPRGKHWSEDSNKFGQKMLEKMGWSNGKGLGANEQGIVEHVRVKVKNDQVGIGYKKDKDDQWTEHQTDFNDFLQNLQKEMGEGSIEKHENVVLSGTSLEEKSKLSQKRVHYKKFTRGKDVNKYSTKDLANIFGKKEVEEIAKKAEMEEEKNNDVIYDPIGAEDNTAGILTVKGGNMHDYFKKKFPSAEENYKEEKNSNSDSNKYNGFGFSTKSSSKFYVNDDVEDEEETPSYAGFGFSKTHETKSKGKKTNNLDYVFDNPCLDLNILDDSPVPKRTLEIKNELNNSDRITPKELKNAYNYADQDINIDCQESKTPKKRKREHVYENEGLDLEYHDKHIAKKRKDDYTYVNQGLDLEYKENSIKLQVQSDNNEESSESKETSKSKKKKKRKNQPLCNGYDNAGLDITYSSKSTPSKPEIVKCEIHSPKNDESNMNLKESKSKKNKKIKSQPLCHGYENAGLDLNYSSKSTSSKPEIVKCEIQSPENDESNINLKESKETAKTKKKKKIKSQPPSNVYENAGLDLNYSSKSSLSEPKIVKCEILSPENDESNINLKESKEKTDTKKKKKKIKSQLSSNAYENAGLDLNYSSKSTSSKPEIVKCEILSPENGESNINLKESKEKTETKKKKKKIKSQPSSNAYENAGLDLDYSSKSSPSKSKIVKSEILSPEYDKSKINLNEISGAYVNPGLDLSINDVNENQKKNLDKEMDKIEENGSNKADICDVNKKKRENAKKRTKNFISRAGRHLPSHWQEKESTGQIMKELFLKCPIVMFNGSNINEIKGYGNNLPLEKEKKKKA